MITLKEDYDLKGTIITIRNTEEARTTPWEAPLITVQLKPLVMLQTYQPWPLTAVKEDWNHNYKADPWAYQSKGKGKMTEPMVAHGMTRSGRCYTSKELNWENPNR